MTQLELLNEVRGIEYLLSGDHQLLIAVGESFINGNNDFDLLEKSTKRAYEIANIMSIIADNDTDRLKVAAYFVVAQFLNSLIFDGDIFNEYCDKIIDFVNEYGILNESRN